MLFENFLSIARRIQSPKLPSSDEMMRLGLHDYNDFKETYMDPAYKQSRDAFFRSPSFSGWLRKDDTPLKS